MSSRLTKKQRKGIAFRERKSSKRKPLGSTLDAADVTDDDGAMSDDGVAAVVAAPATKRKRSPPPIIHEKNIAKKPKLDPDASVEVESNTETKDEGAKSSQTTRYILFLGNLRYSTSKDAIIEHFSSCDPPPQVRLMTQKDSNKSKGCAFLEFSHRNALQQGLKLHHTRLDGRQVNVELTAGGGGKSSARTEKLKQRNAKLQQERQNRIVHGNPQPTAESQLATKQPIEQVKIIARPNHQAPDDRSRSRSKKKLKSDGSEIKPYRPSGPNALPIG